MKASGLLLKTEQTETSQQLPQIQCFFSDFEPTLMLHVEVLATQWFIERKKSLISSAETHLFSSFQSGHRPIRKLEGRGHDNQGSKFKVPYSFYSWVFVTKCVPVVFCIFIFYVMVVGFRDELVRIINTSIPITLPSLQYPRLHIKKNSTMSNPSPLVLHF